LERGSQIQNDWTKGRIIKEAPPSKGGDQKTNGHRSKYCNSGGTETSSTNDVDADVKTEDDAEASMKQTLEATTVQGSVVHA